MEKKAATGATVQVKMNSKTNSFPGFSIVTNKQIISLFTPMMTDSMKDVFVKINAFQNSF